MLLALPILLCGCFYLSQFWQDQRQTLFIRNLKKFYDAMGQKVYGAAVYFFLAEDDLQQRE